MTSFPKYTMTFNNCKSLSCVIINSIKGNVSFDSSKAISKACILYIIQNAAPTTAIALTLHHDAYVRLTSDEDIINALDAKNAALTGGGKISLVCATHSDEVTPNA